jgi:hypothetical protein
VALWHCFNLCGDTDDMGFVYRRKEKSLKAFQMIEDQMEKDALQKRDDNEE